MSNDDCNEIFTAIKLGVRRKQIDISSYADPPLISTRLNYGVENILSFFA